MNGNALKLRPLRVRMDRLLREVRLAQAKVARAVGAAEALAYQQAPQDVAWRRIGRPTDRPQDINRADGLAEDVPSLPPASPPPTSAQAGR